MRNIRDKNIIQRQAIKSGSHPTSKSGGVNRQVIDVTMNDAYQLIQNGFKFLSNQFKKVGIMNFPPHQYTPQGASTFDFARLVTVGAGTTDAVIMEYEVKTGDDFVLTHYAIFNDALLTSDAWFTPRVDGNRILQYHGDPMDDFKISLGRTPDLSNDALIESNIRLKKGRKITWTVTNSGAVDVDMGLRLKGYIDNQQVKVSSPTMG